MREFFFGPLAITGWAIASAVFVFCATYLWLIVREVGGLRGSVLATIFTCLAVICACFGMILAKQPWIPNYVLGAIVTTAFIPIVLGAVILTDLYSADRNSHRSFTARSYLWYKRATKSSDDGGPHHPVELMSPGGRNAR